MKLSERKWVLEFYHSTRNVWEVVGSKIETLPTATKTLEKFNREWPDDIWRIRNVWSKEIIPGSIFG